MIIMQKMKFRITPAAIFSSLLIVLLVAAFVVLAVLPDFGSGLVDRIISGIDLPQPLSVKVGSVDRSFFRKLVFNDIALYLDGIPILSTEKMEMSVSLQNLILHLFKGEDVYDLKLENPIISLNQKQYDKLSSLFFSTPDEETKKTSDVINLDQYGSDPAASYRQAMKERAIESRLEKKNSDNQALLSSLINRTGMRLWLVNGKAEIRMDDFSFIADGLDFAFSTKPGLSFISANLNSNLASLKMMGQDFSFADIRVAVDEGLNLSLSMKEADAGFGVMTNAYISLEASGLFDKYMRQKEASDPLIAKLFADTVSVSYLDIDSNASKLSAIGSFDLNTNDASLSLSFGSIQAQSIDWSFQGSELALSSNGNIDDQLNYIINIGKSSAESSLIGKERQKALLSQLHAKGEVDLADRRLSSSVEATGIQFEGFEEFGIKKPNIDELSFNFLMSGNVLRGECLAVADAVLDDLFLGNVQGEILADFEFLSSDDFSVNLQVDDLSLSTLPDKLGLTGELVRKPGSSTQLTLSGTIGESVRVNATYNLDDSSGNAYLRMEDFKPSRYESHLSLLSEGIATFIRDDTSLDLYFSLDIAKMKPLAISSNFDLAVRNVQLGQNPFNFALSFYGSYLDSLLEVRQLVVSSDEYRIDYSGKIGSSVLDFSKPILEVGLPVGVISLKKSSDAREIASLEIANADDGLFDLDLKLADSPDFSYQGKVNAKEAGILKIKSDLSYWNASYPLDIMIDLKEMILAVDSNGLNLDVQYKDERLSIDGIAESFELKVPNGSSWIIGFNLNGIYRTDSEIFNFDLNNFTLSGNELKMLGFNLHADTRQIRIDDIRFGNNLDDLFLGNAILQYDDPKQIISKTSSLVVSLGSEGGESFDASVIDSRFLIDAQKFNLERVGADGQLNLRVLGRAGDESYGNFTYINRDGEFRCNLRMDDRSISITDLFSTFGEVNLGESRVSFDRATGMLNMMMNLSMDVDLPQGNKKYLFNGELNSDIYSLKQELSSVVSQIVKSPVSALNINLDMEKLLYDLSAVLDINEMRIGDLSLGSDSLKLRLSPKQLIGSGKLISFNYINGSGDFSLKIKKDWGIGIDAKGNIANDKIHVSVDELHFPLVLLNELIDTSSVPVIGGIATGQVEIFGPWDDLNFHGMLYCDEVRVSVFWVPNTEFAVSNAVVSVSGTEAYSPTQRLEVFRTDTGQRSYGKFSAWLNIPTLEFDLDVNLDDSATIGLWIPMSDINLDVTADVYGRVHIGDDGVTYLKGPIAVSNMLVDFDLSDKVVPQWYLESTGSSDFIFDVVLAENNQVFYPNSTNPILSLKISDNDRIGVNYNSRKETLDVTGAILLRGGQIYYFSKDFLVTKGKIILGESNLSQVDGLDVSLDLQAKMRDYDSNGNKVDIYLNLQNSSLTNLNPHFTSVPSLSENEILELLGESILPQSVFSSMSLSSLASVTVAAAQAVGKLGIIQTGAENLGLTNVIRDSLNLDIFSVRTGLLQNIVIDALPGSTFNSDLSPLSRYLDGTSIYVGKNLSENLFLQTAISLKANNSSSGSAKGGFLSEDLKVDFEISLDWDNPLAVFSFFAQPEELSVFNLFDTMGFSVTKSIQF